MTCEIVIFSTEEQAKKEMMDICDQNECLYNRHTMQLYDPREESKCVATLNKIETVSSLL